MKTTEKGISFFSKQTRIREFYSVSELKGKAFADVAEDLYKRLLLEGKTLSKLTDNCSVCSLSKQSRELTTAEWIQNVISWLIS